MYKLNLKQLFPLIKNKQLTKWEELITEPSKKEEKVLKLPDVNKITDFLEQIKGPLNNQ